MAQLADVKFLVVASSLSAFLKQVDTTWASHSRMESTEEHKQSGPVIQQICSKYKTERVRTFLESLLEMELNMILLQQQWRQQR